jgi:uncharacterized protein with HEPN domain
MNSIDRIASYIDDVSFEIFETDEKTIDAVVRNLEIIGEAARHVPEDFIKTNPQVA